MIASTVTHGLMPVIRVDGDRQREGDDQRAAQRRGDQRGRRDGQQHDDRLDDGELVDLAGVATQGCEIGPAEPADEMRDQEVAPRRRSVDVGGVGAVGALRDEGEAGIAGDGDQRPDQDVGAHAGEQAGRADQQHQQRDGRRAVDHGARHAASAARGRRPGCPTCCDSRSRVLRTARATSLLRCGLLRSTIFLSAELERSNAIWCSVSACIGLPRRALFSSPGRLVAND